MAEPQPQLEPAARTEEEIRAEAVANGCDPNTEVWDPRTRRCKPKPVQPAE